MRLVGKEGNGWRKWMGRRKIEGVEIVVSGCKAWWGG